MPLASDKKATHRPEKCGIPKESPQESAERWHVSVDTIRRLISTGKITGYRLNGRIIRVSADEVDACFREIPTVRQASGA